MVRDELVSAESVSDLKVGDIFFEAKGQPELQCKVKVVITKYNKKKPQAERYTIMEYRGKEYRFPVETLNLLMSFGLNQIKRRVIR